MNKAIEAIENGLDLEISISDLAKIACYSEFHFYRLFNAYVGESVYAFRKRLLLERSVRSLHYSNKSITYIAFDAGYNNSSSFNKAFKKHFNCKPSDARQKLIVFESFQLPKIDRKIDMKAEIVQLNDIKVIAARGVGKYDEIAAEAWGRIMKFAYGNKHMHNTVRRFGVSHDDPNVTAPDNIRYDACLDIDVDISTADNLRKFSIAGPQVMLIFLINGCPRVVLNYAQILVLICTSTKTRAELNQKT
jgi:AraC family transcriptional regulator